MGFPEREYPEPFRLADMTRPQQLGHPSTWPVAAQPPPAATDQARPAPGRRNRRPLLFVLGAAALVVVLAAAGIVYVFAFSSVTVSGTLTVAGAGRGFGAGECRGTGGYSDIVGGATVTITDASGKTIALGHLDPGKATANNCIFGFSVNAPRSDFYGIEVSHRGVTKVSRAEAKAGVELGLGF